jgi:hypothetical protein
MTSLKDIKVKVESSKKKINETNDVFKYMQTLSPPDRFHLLKWLPESTRLTSKVLKETFAKIANPTHPLLEIPITELNYWFKILLFGKPGTTQEETSAKISTDFAKWLKVIPAMATHQGKLINPKSSSTFCLTHKGPISSQPYVSSRSFSKKKNLAYCGNATYLGKRALLETEFIFQNQITSVFNALLNKDQTIISALKKIGLTEIQVSRLHKAVLETINSARLHVHDDAAQTLFPVNESYVSITALPSVAVLNEIRQRIKDIGSTTDHVVLTERTKVGGANAQNSGSFNMMVGGMQTHLISQIPKVQYIPIDRIFFRLKKFKTLFYHDGKKASFPTQTLENWRNEDRRRYLTACIDPELNKIMSGANRLRNYLNQGGELREDFHQISGIHAAERRYIESMQPDSDVHLSKEDKRALRRKVAEVINRALTGSPPKEYMRLIRALVTERF